MATNTGKKSSSTILSNGSRSTTSEGRVAYFYQSGHLATEFSDKGPRRILWSPGIAIALLGPIEPAKPLEIDQTNSFLGSPPDSVAYSPYGHFDVGNSAGLVAFNGQRLDLTTHGYALGNGHRMYRPGLRRFCSPDTLSPFSTGGLNAYSYCENDPVNNADPSGQTLIPIVKSGLYRNGPSGNPPTPPRPSLGHAYHIAEKQTLAAGARSFPARPREIRHRELLLTKLSRATQAEISRLDRAIKEFPLNSAKKINEAHSLIQASQQASAVANQDHWDSNTQFRYNASAQLAEGKVKHFFNTNPDIERRYKIVAQHNQLIEKLESINADISKLRST